MKNLPVYVVCGMLESGKTSFTQETLSGMAKQGRTLLIICEEGEVEYELDNPYVSVVTIADKEELTEQRLKQLDKQYKPTQVFVEYNGMWPLVDLAEVLPKHWLFFQCICFIDATSFDVYLRNMPELMMDKIRNADMMIFNRCSDAHVEDLAGRNLRMLNRNAEIYLEHVDGKVEDYRNLMTDVFDMSKELISVSDEEFGALYVDILERTDRYVGKKVTFKGLVFHDEKMGDVFSLGRVTMTCCEDDVFFSGICCQAEPGAPLPKHGSWVSVTGTVLKAYQDYYEADGPLIHVEQIAPAEQPAQPVISV